MGRRAENLKLERELLPKPGDTLLETLGHLKMTQVQLADRLDLTPSKVNDLISGKEPISINTAINLQIVLGIDAQFWINSQVIYDEKLARIEREEKLLNEMQWIKSQPIKILKQFGFINHDSEEAALINDIFNFYGVVGRDPWEKLYATKAIPVFRRNTKKEIPVNELAAILRIGEIGMSKMNLIEYNRVEFRKCLEEIKSLVRNHHEDFPGILQKTCLKAGVAIVYTPYINGAQISGITRWYNGNPLIQLTDRFKSNDEFWITFFHESGHVIKHGKKDMFFEYPEGSMTSEEKELEADEFAYKTLFPHTDLDELPENLDIKKIREIARTNLTHPAVVLKALQKKEKIAFNFGNNLKIGISLKYYINSEIK